MKPWNSDLRYLLAASVGALALACGAEGASTSGSAVVTGKVALAANDTATPPGQPTSGPGDSHYTSESKKTQIQVPILFGPTYFAYTPDPAVTNAPLLVYAHGAGQTDPTSYETVLTHFARKGFVVIFPV